MMFEVDGCVEVRYGQTIDHTRVGWTRLSSYDQLGLPAATPSTIQVLGEQRWFSCLHPEKGSVGVGGTSEQIQ